MDIWVYIERKAKNSELRNSLGFQRVLFGARNFITHAMPLCCTPPLLFLQDVIQKPMIKTENKLVKKEAAEMFKLIQTYMGDRKLSRDAPSSSLVMDIVMKGWSVAELRDEIFIQICRQTTRNPREFVYYGFLLLLMVTLNNASD